MLKDKLSSHSFLVKGTAGELEHGRRQQVSLQRKGICQGKRGEITKKIFKTRK